MNKLPSPTPDITSQKTREQTIPKTTSREVEKTNFGKSPPKLTFGRVFSRIFPSLDEEKSEENVIKPSTLPVDNPTRDLALLRGQEKFRRLSRILNDEEALAQFRIVMSQSQDLHHLEFVIAVEKYKQCSDDNRAEEMANKIYEQYLKEGAVNMVNLEQDTDQMTNLKVVRLAMEEKLTSPKRDLFDRCVKFIRYLIADQYVYNFNFQNSKEFSVLSVNQLEFDLDRLNILSPRRRPTLENDDRK